MHTTTSKNKLNITSQDISNTTKNELKKNKTKNIILENKNQISQKNLKPKNTSFINNIGNSLSPKANINQNQKNINEISNIYNCSSPNPRPISVSRLQKNNNKSYYEPILNTCENYMIKHEKTNSNVISNNNNLENSNFNTRKFSNLTEGGSNGIREMIHSESQNGQLITSIKKSRNDFYKSMTKNNDINKVNVNSYNNKTTQNSNSNINNKPIIKKENLNNISNKFKSNFKEKKRPYIANNTSNYKNILSSSSYISYNNNIVSFSNIHTGKEKTKPKINNSKYKRNKILNTSEKINYISEEINLDDHIIKTNNLNSQININDQTTNSNNNSHITPLHSKNKSVGQFSVKNFNKNVPSNDTVYNTNYIINFIDSNNSKQNKNSFKNISPLTSNDKIKNNKINEKYKYKNKEYSVIPISSNILSRSSSNYYSFQVFPKKKKNSSNYKFESKKSSFTNNSGAKINSIKKKSTYNYFERKEQYLANGNEPIKEKKNTDYINIEDIDGPEEMHFYMNTLVRKTKEISVKYELIK